MKIVLIACLLGVALAAPQSQRGVARARQLRPEARQDVHPNNFLEVLRDERSPVIGAIFRYLFETENKIFEEREGTEGSQGQSNFAGTYRWETPEGETVEVRYVADENGFQPESAHIPTPHPLPAHAIEQIRIAEEQRAAGIRWDERGFRI